MFKRRTYCVYFRTKAILANSIFSQAFLIKILGCRVCTATHSFTFKRLRIRTYRMVYA
ncbi:uncharacterized protein BDR25DRAFT_10129 [Lindgomyces ingoldianus]|uniref:Uncharacterized protein n=1 Tax=Lindgomyces ingoldianus TaxID=673940 RepID=A0ACB6RHX6_9PLEO|nr:uncharacterized protein BDR25DRAFT_10129 [Lindgomyces ingoldianus]KAF2478330.1 hypothetical protein BDR25DRAFT_10129 [Lindgomyces ingoldianus]